MTSPLSNELFFQVHRGLAYHRGEKTNKGALGMHWSATPWHAEERASRHLRYGGHKGEVWHGTASISAVETDTARLKERGYAGFEGKDPLGEKEVPLKEGAPVTVTGVTKYRIKEHRHEQGFITGTETKRRERRFNPPREMKA
jgi:hypothetical protein